MSGNGKKPGNRQDYNKLKKDKARLREQLSIAKKALAKSCMCKYAFGFSCIACEALNDIVLID